MESKHFTIGMSMADETLKITVVTVVYNLVEAGRIETFRQCVQSVHEQTYGNVEHLIIDGASTDGTLALIKEFEDKGWVTCRSEADSGIYDAMNKGIRAARGDYVIFLNSDDFYHDKQGLARAAKYLQAKKADFGYSRMVVKGMFREIRKYSNVKLCKMLWKMPFPHPTLLVKKTVMEELGLFDTEFQLVGDYDFILRMLLKGYKGVHIPGDFVTFRQGGATDVRIPAREMPLAYYKNYAPIANVSMDECVKIYQSYLIPFRLLNKLLWGKYSLQVKLTALFAMLYNLKNRHKRFKSL